jgi:UDP-N-acetylmuramoyl-L-alanyl-D-glutamate--2,6-diaminopimelate ligase
MKLKNIIKDLKVELIKGSKEVEITGISLNSKSVAWGNLFISTQGSSGQGHLHILEAINAGCRAIITDLFNPFYPKITQVIVKDVAKLVGTIAANFYNHPSKKIFNVAITGTCGKTTTSFLVKHLLDECAIACGLIGSVEYITGKNKYKAALTTPDAILNQKLLNEMHESGLKASVMEVSSHALDQMRVDRIEFDIAIFTNLSQDHLDYHQTMEEYAKAKQKLFQNYLNGSFKKGLPQVKAALVNIDSPWCYKMVENCKEKVLTYGFSEQAAIRAFDISLGPIGSTFKVCYEGRIEEFAIALMGKFNISNALASIGVGLLIGIDLKVLKEIFKKASPPQGRLERVPNKLGLNIFVDFAHKDDALKNVLECLRELNPNKIITVFGCGGNRDRGKRPKMAQVAESLSNEVIITSDNPRDEDPLSIIEEIKLGFQDKEKHFYLEDRKSAIQLAIQRASKDDIVLIAGKGHETYQIFAHKTIDFDDRLVAYQACLTRE